MLRRSGVGPRDRGDRSAYLPPPLSSAPAIYDTMHSPGPAGHNIQTYNYDPVQIRKHHLSKPPAAPADRCTHIFDTGS